MADIQVTREDEGSRGRYVARVAGREGEAELTYVVTSPTVVSVSTCYFANRLSKTVKQVFNSLTNSCGVSNSLTFVKFLKSVKSTVTWSKCLAME